MYERLCVCERETEKEFLIGKLYTPWENVGKKIDSKRRLYKPESAVIFYKFKRKTERVKEKDRDS